NTYTSAITVANLAPTATDVAPSTLVEGTVGVLSLVNGTDPSSVDAASLHYAFDTNGDGTYDVGDGTYAGSGTASTTTMPAPDGPGSVQVRERVIDKDGGQTTYTHTVTITNAPPSGDLQVPANADEGSIVTARISNANDLSQADRATLRFAIDIGDDGTYEL